MEVIIRSSREEAEKMTAAMLATAVETKPGCVLGLATGRTMEAVYAELARLHRDKGLDFSQVCTFNLDEYIGLAPDDPNSYRYYMQEKLFDHINIDPQRTYLPDGLNKDIKQEGPHYEAQIRYRGGIDLQLLGIGEDGHIGFNEPLSSFASRTRDVTLTPETIAQNSPMFQRPEDMPRRAFTMGVGTILEARRIVMLVTGAGKARVLAAAVEGPLAAIVPASALQFHQNAVVIVDAAAASELRMQEYYRWGFENDPRWEGYR